MVRSMMRAFGPYQRGTHARARAGFGWTTGMRAHNRDRKGLTQSFFDDSVALLCYSHYWTLNHRGINPTNREDTMKLRIEIDDAMRVTVSRPCESCGVMVPTDEYCGEDGKYLCFDCYGQQLADRKYIHDWLIVLVDFDWTTDVRVAIHKEVATAKTIDIADCSSPDPDDDISRFGPGTSAHTLGMDDIDGLHADVNAVYCLVDSGLIDGQTAPTIFKTQGGE